MSLRKRSWLTCIEQQRLLIPQCISATLHKHLARVHKKTNKHTIRNQLHHSAISKNTTSTRITGITSCKRMDQRDLQYNWSMTVDKNSERRHKGHEKYSAIQH